jgi:hypothetical protein
VAGMGWRVVAGGLADSGQDRLKTLAPRPQHCWTVTVTVMWCWCVSSGLRGGNGRSSGASGTPFRDGRRWLGILSLRIPPPAVFVNRACDSSQGPRTPCSACPGRLAAGRAAVS